MANYLYVDANTLGYAARSGGRSLLDAYFTYAQQSGFEVRITDVVRAEILRGPWNKIIGTWIKDHSILIIKTQSYNNFLSSGKGKSWGDYSIIEAMKSDLTASSSNKVNILSDDGFFQRTQNFRMSGNQNIAKELMLRMF